MTTNHTPAVVDRYLAKCLAITPAATDADVEALDRIAEEAVLVGVEIGDSVGAEVRWRRLGERKWTIAKAETPQSETAR